MQYSEALNFIHGIARFGSKLGLDNVKALLESMGTPQNKLQFVHVAGTNGKGSTCTMISYALKQAGYKTGLFISPFVLDFCERIQVNNEMIDQDELAKSTELVKSHWDKLNSIGTTPTEFEVVFAIAMDYFVKSGCEIVVLEVGLGGRLDATNIIEKPLCSVITSISIDHTEYLGNTIDQITAEKCGIIKDGGITISYPNQPPQAAEIIANICSQRNNKLIIGQKPQSFEMNIGGSKMQYAGLEVAVPFAGEHQIYNAITAIETLKALVEVGIKISELDIVAGISAAKFPSRLETLNESPLILLDGAHNLSGVAALAKSLHLIKGRRIHAVVGIMSDKDVDGMLKEILPLCYSLTTFMPANPRSKPANEIAKIAEKYCQHVYIAGTPDSAVIQPLSHCENDDVILMFGSLYFASEIRPTVIKVLGQFA